MQGNAEGADIAIVFAWAAGPDRGVRAADVRLYRNRG